MLQTEGQKITFNEKYSPMYVPNFVHFTHPQLRQRQASFIEIQHGLACSVPYTPPIRFLVHNSHEKNESL